MYLKSTPEGEFFLGDECEALTPALRLFLKRGDDGEWAKVQGKLPIPSFSAKAGNPDRQSAKHYHRR